MLLPNPGQYSERQNTNVRLDPDVKEALDKYTQANKTTFSDVINDLLREKLKAYLK